MLTRTQYKGTLLVKLEKSLGGKLEYVHVRKEMKAEMEQGPEKAHEVKKLIPLHPRIRPNGRYFLNLTARAGINC